MLQPNRVDLSGASRKRGIRCEFTASFNGIQSSITAAPIAKALLVLLAPSAIRHFFSRRKFFEGNRLAIGRTGEQGSEKTPHGIRTNLFAVQ
jgi:hypothetical protein